MQSKVFMATNSLSLSGKGWSIFQNSYIMEGKRNLLLTLKILQIRIRLCRNSISFNIAKLGILKTYYNENKKVKA